MNLKDQASEIAKRVLNSSANDEEAIETVTAPASVLRSQGADLGTIVTFYQHLLNALSTRIIAMEAASDEASSRRAGILRVAEAQAGEVLKSVQQEAMDERKGA